MQYKKLTGTSLQVSQISLGTMMFGGQTSQEDSFAIMDYAFANGVNVFDTANVYNQGDSEKIVGNWLKGKRDQIILATKVFGQMGSNPNDSGLSRRNILAAVEQSLARLQTDYIDLYYLHSPDYNTDIDETMQAMNQLVQSGKIRYIGVSNYAAWQIADILAVCETRNYVKPVITQNVYNPITRGIESELVPFLNHHKMALTVYNPIAGGLLAGKHKPGKPADNTRFALNKTYYDRYWSKENFEAVENLTAIAQEHNMSILQLAMRWCAIQPHVTTIISGVSKLEQLRQNLQSVEGGPLSEQAIAQCDDVWRGLAGTRYAYNR